MQKRTFRYCRTHREDEKYMQEMCARGWAAVRLVEGFWTFEECTPGEYCYRMAYLRGKSREEAEILRRQWAEQGIELVSRYSFWAILRSRKEFQLYEGGEEKEICRKIYAPMPAGAAISWLLTALGIWLALRCSAWFWIAVVLIGLYAGMCTWLGAAYRRLLRTMA